MGEKKKKRIIFLEWVFVLPRALTPHLKKLFIGLAYQGKDIVFRYITKYSSLRDLSPYVIIGLFSYEDFLKDDILACVET